MTPNLRYVFSLIAFGFILFIVGMATSTTIEVFASSETELSYYIFGVGLSFCLLFIAYAMVFISKPFLLWQLFFQLIFTLAFVNAGDEITNTADVFKISEFWIAFGLIYYFCVLINEAIIKKRK